MKILVIAPEPFFTPRGTPFSVYYRTSVSGELDHQIDLLTYGQGLDVDLPHTRLIRIPGFRRLGRIKVGPSFFKLFLDIFMIAYTVGLLATRRYDLVHAHEESVFFCRFLKPLFGYKLVYDMHSSLPQQLTNFEFTSSKTLVKIFKMLEDSCLKKADAVITICPDLADYVNRLLNNPEKHFLIENSIFDPIHLKAPDNATAAPASSPMSPDIPENIKKKGLHYIVYAGTLEAYQGIDILIPAFQIFAQSHNEFRLLIVGGSPRQVKQYRKLADEHGLSQSCILTGQVSQARAREYSQMADILVSPRKQGTNTPLKVYEQLASGTPLVATRIHSHTQVLSDDVAILIEPEPKSMADGFETAITDVGQEKVEKARTLYTEKYSRDVYMSKMRNLYQHLETHPRT